MKELFNREAAQGELNSIYKNITGINEVIDAVNDYTGQWIQPDDVISTLRHEKDPVNYIFSRILKMAENTFKGHKIEPKQYPSIKDHIDTYIRQVRISADFENQTYQEGNYLVIDDKVEKSIKQKYTLKIDPVLDKYNMAVELAKALNHARPLIELNQNRPLPAGLKVENGVYSVNDEFFIELLR